MILEKLNSFHIKGLNFHFCLLNAESLRTKKREFAMFSDNIAVSDLSNPICKHYSHGHLTKISDFNIETISVQSDSFEFDFITNSIAGFKNEKSIIVEKPKKGKIKEFDLKDLIINIDYYDDCIVIKKQIVGVNIFDILFKVFNIARNQAGALSIKRLSLSNAKKFISS